MRTKWNLAEKTKIVRAIRRCVEYAITIGLALLSGYWIVNARW